MRIPFTRQTLVLYLAWCVLAGAVLYGLVAGRYPISFVALLTLGLTIVPLLLPSLVGIRIPSGFTAAIALFLIGTLLLGEAADFYERFWWWDLVMHGGSSIGLGLAGTVLMLILVRGQKLSAAPFTVAMFAFCFALSIGALWEIFEFSMDQVFGLNMQKSGLVDTMTDLMVGTLGGALGAAAGYVTLRWPMADGPARWVRDFVRALVPRFPEV